MKNQTIKLFNTAKEWMIFLLLLFIVASVNLINEYKKYKIFSDEEFFQTSAVVVNIYKKEDYQIIRLQTKFLDFYSSVSLDEKFEQFDTVTSTIITTNISFLDFLKGFYAPTINTYKIGRMANTKTKIADFISNQHETKIFKELYNALFLAIPVSKELRLITADFGISHLIAISGFHLGVISFLTYWIIYFPYSFFHSRHFPYRNKKYDILLLTIFVLFIYLIFTNIIPSFLRAFVMFTIGIYFLRNNIKLLSFETLLIVVLLILSFFPRYIFSISLWFSLSGVFYIYLYIHYFKDMPKWGHILLFNPWIYLSMNPVTNFFFGTTSYLQLFSSPLSLAFTVFYPLSGIFHLFGYGGVFDSFIQKIFDINAHSSDVPTPFWFFIVYILFSFIAIYKKMIFIILNFLLVGFTVYIYYVNSQQQFFLSRIIN